MAMLLRDVNAGGAGAGAGAAAAASRPPIDSELPTVRSPSADPREVSRRDDIGVAGVGDPLAAAGVRGVVVVTSRADRDVNRGAGSAAANAASNSSIAYVREVC